MPNTNPKTFTRPTLDILARTVGGMIADFTADDTKTPDARKRAGARIVIALMREWMTATEYKELLAAARYKEKNELDGTRHIVESEA